MIRDKSEIKRILKNLKKVRKKRVVLGATGSHGKLSNARLLAIHESGGGHIPARAPIRKTFSNEKTLQEIEKFAVQMLETILDGNDASSVLQGIGLKMKTEVQATIKNRLEPPNVASTLKRKIGDVPLISKEQLVNSIDFQVKRR